MKYTNFLKTILFLSAIACILSCSEKKYETVVPKIVDVTSGADIAFKAIGGEGDIQVSSSEGQVTATTQQSDWCHLTQNGNTIHVVVDNHSGLESRYAVIDLKAGEATGKTIVHQYGIIVRSILYSPTMPTNPSS